MRRRVYGLRFSSFSSVVVFVYEKVKVSLISVNVLERPAKKQKSPTITTRVFRSDFSNVNSVKSREDYDFVCKKLISDVQIMKL